MRHYSTSKHKQHIQDTLTKEFLIDRFITQGLEYDEIAKEVGCSRSTINTWLRKYGLRKHRPIEDLTNRKFGMLLVLKRLKGNKQNNVVWECKCDCGNITNVLGGNLRSGTTKSCGHKKYLKGKDNHCWKGCGDISGRYWSIIQANAEKRNILFDISIEYAWNLFLQQNKKCALSGWNLEFSNSNTQTASLDRKDSSKGYIKDNIQWLHKDINFIKMDFEQDYLLKICKDIVEYRKL